MRKTTTRGQAFSLYQWMENRAEKFSLIGKSGGSNFPIIGTFSTSWKIGLGMVCGLFFLSGSLLAAEFYADASRPDDSGDGTSWATAKQTIQAAVDAAQAGDTVWVTNGVYDVGEMVTPGFSSTNRVCVTKAITVQSVNGAEVTVIDGGGSIRCVYLGAGTMSGFTLTNGDVSITSGNFENTSGGGAFLLNGAVMHSCTLSGSSAMHGGGAYVIGTLSNCVLSGNSATYDGGGVDGYATVDNCLFVGNSAGDEGGGAYVLNKLNNCTLVGNSAVQGSGGAYLDMGARICNSVAWGNTSSIGNRDIGGILYYCYNTCASDGVTAGQDGCITNNPLFVSTNDFRLQAGSPCINAGNNAYAPSGTDLAGNTRIIFGTVDMGAYEVQVLLSTNRGPAVGGGSLVVTNGHLGDGADITNVTVCGSVASVTDQGSNWVQVTLGASTNFAVDVTGDVVIQSTSVGETTFADAYTYELRPNKVFYASASRLDDSGAGTNWATAKRTIQAAVDLTYDGDTVWVTNGVYDVGGAVAPGCALTNRVCITNAITVQSVNGPEATILVGADAMRGVYMAGGGALIGFSITNGHTLSDGGLDGQGGGLWMTSGCVASNLIVSGNTGDIGGGGAYLNSGGILHNCALIGNTAVMAGGGVFLEDSSTLNNCTVIDNTSGYCGGGVYLDFGGVVNNSLLIGNTAAVDGGGACLNGGGGTLNNCTLSGNTAGQYGSGTFLFTSDSTLNNCIVWGNSGTQNICRHYGTVRYTCSPDGVTNGVDGCITNNPLFVDAASSNYHLNWASPCIEAGDTGSWTASDRDLDGCPRLAGARVDMGCYETPQGPERMLHFTNNKGNTSFTSLVAVADSDSLDLTNGFTCELWFCPGWLGGDTNTLFAKLSEPAGTGYGLRYVGETFVFSAWGKQDYEFSPGTIHYVWHHIAVVFDADNNVTFYVNGVSNVTIAGAAPAGVGTGALQVGFMEGSRTGYDGRMDEIRFWNTERTPEQIRDNMHRHLTGREPGLEAYYRCNQVSGDVLPDWSTNNNDGVLLNCAWEDSTAVIGNDQIAQGVNARAVWTAYKPVTPFAPGGLQLISTQPLGSGRSVFAHNGESGVVYSNLPAGLVRSSRIWYNETAPSNSYALNVSCVFDQCGAEALKGCAATNYQLLYRVGETGDFAAVGVATTVDTAQVTFENMAMTTGWYALGIRNEISLIPDNGSCAGGNTVCFTNGLFGVVTNVLVAQVGQTPVACGTNWFTLIMPPATNAGSVDMVVQTKDYGEITLAGAYTYKESQTIDFPVIGVQRVTHSVALAATASSGLPVTYSIESGPGVIVSNSVLQFTSNGIVVVCVSQDGDATWDAARAEQSVRVIKQAAYLDFDGDGTADVAVYCPQEGTWYILQSATLTERTQPWGWPDGVPAPGDYDGDGMYDVAVYCITNGMWYIWQSDSESGKAQAWGYAGAGSVPADYDGDGITDVAVYDVSAGSWLIWQSATQTARTQAWGFDGGVPVPGDYDGDGLADPAVYDRGSGVWYILQSTTGTGRTQPWGWVDAEPIPGDYDGDGLTDVAVYWPEDGMWYGWLSGSQTGMTGPWGWVAAAPVPADYDGDGIFDRTVYAPIYGMWYLWQSETQTSRIQPWGFEEAEPVN
ncbi:MAG: choice-of-anchor Q domain-containing protein [Kiritimatiellae bacterium]|nr:choice-of-anchor Q domain-containing protein [Kiritimatiellia bacterium]